MWLLVAGLLGACGALLDLLFGPAVVVATMLLLTLVGIAWMSRE